MRINGFLFATVTALTLLLGQDRVLAAIQQQPNDAYLQGWKAYDAGQYSQALHAWLPLAEQGDPRAQLNLGTLYDYGQGVGENPSAAVHWYNAAAAQGKALAQFNLGVMYASGRGTIQDYSQAALWYFKAAEQGLSDAQLNLALQFSNGQGVKADPGLALQWLYRAGQGYLEADRPDNVRSVIAHMNSLEGSQQLAQELSEQLTSLGLPDTEGFWENASVGTGWPIASGYVVTNNHVVGDSVDIVLVDGGGTKISATIVARDQQRDLVLLGVSDPRQLPPPLPLAGQRARLGTSVFTIGYPRIDILGKTPKLTAGLVSSINGLEDDPSRYQLSLPIQSGNSGGPLINMHGEVVGVITSMLGSIDASGNTSPLSNVSYAVKVDFLRDMLNHQSLPTRSMPSLVLADNALEEMADRIQHSVLIVRAK